MEKSENFSKKIIKRKISWIKKNICNYWFNIFLLKDCNFNQDKNGALCYPKCQNGYTGVGPVCWENCPHGWSDTGAFCQIWSETKGKGCCCTVFTQGCCGNCEAGYSDTGCTCFRGDQIFAKKFYGRGAGTPLVCASNQQQDGGLCYDYCKVNHKGVGPVCWRNCPAYNGYQCGGLCVSNEKNCSSFIQNMVLSQFSLGMSVFQNFITGGVNIGGWLDSYSAAAGTIAPFLNDS